METKLVDGKGRDVWTRCGFSDGLEVPRVGLSGGLILAWMDRPSFKVQLVTNHLIHIDLLDNKGKPVSITFVYGHPELAWREEVWQQLSSIKAFSHVSWFCIGDFNQILSRDEKFSFTQGRISGASLFQKVISDRQFCDLAASGQQYTWMNNREDNEFIMERLDRAFATVEWVNMYPCYSLRNLPIIRSDHGPIILDFEFLTPFRRRPFRFEHMWTTHPSCESMIRQAWESNSVGSRAAQLWAKLLSIRKSARNWNKSVFGKLDYEIKLKQTQLQQIQNSIRSVEDVRKERLLRGVLEELLDREEMMWAQKARTQWILQGDRNTKYFQTVVRQRRAKNRILQIKDSTGNTIEDQMEIETILVEHFRNCFENKSQANFHSVVQELQALPVPFLSDQHRLLLDKPITPAEIENTIFQLGSHKAPGPDGLPAFFFQKFWSIVKMDVINTVQAFFYSGSLFKPLNHTFITLIPKVPFPDEVSHFRPISLCNVIYKVISKIMVNKLKPIMDSLITPYQNAFIKGRNITDNILIAHEIIDVFRKKKGRKASFGTLKIDMSKAYDRVDWMFLKAVLTVMKFKDRWIQWIMECVTSVSYTLLVNGNSTSSFKPSQGLR